MNNLSKVATQWNSDATRNSNRGRRVLIPSALTTTQPSHHLIATRLEDHQATNLIAKNMCMYILCCCQMIVLQIIACR